jgi:1-deoxy-D-xylulose-5-phosphate synthase
MTALKFAKSHDGPIMIHIITQKGKGHQPAELDPIKYHGVAPKKKEGATVAPKVKTYTEVFGDTSIAICNKREDVVVITPAMEGGSGLTPFKAAHPNRFYDVGIAEEHAVTFAGGLARGGVRPILAIYSSFLQRGFDQLVHDVCLQKLPVVFALDRAGIAGEDGATHHGLLDFAYLLPVPHIAILAPKDGKELEDMLWWSIDHPEAVAIRYPKGPIPDQNGLIATPIHTMKAEVLCEFPNSQSQFDVLIIGVGSMAWPSYEAAEILNKQDISVASINLRFVKPLDLSTLIPYISRSKHIVVIEEVNAIGGVFSYILEEACTTMDRPLSDWHHIAIPDEFLDHGKMATLREKYDLSTAGIVRRVLSRIETSA